MGNLSIGALGKYSNPSDWYRENPLLKYYQYQVRQDPLANDRMKGNDRAVRQVWDQTCQAQGEPDQTFIHPEGALSNLL